MKSGACSTMYESFYGLKEKPFTLLPDPEYLYLSTKHQRALTLLEYGMLNKAGFSIICGEMGVGKTTLIRHLITKLDENILIGFVADADNIHNNVTAAVLSSFGLEGDGKGSDEMLQLFKAYLIEQSTHDKQLVLIVDEAHHLVSEELESLHALADITDNKDQLLQIILVGQVGLRETLRLPELEKFAQRIAVDYSLGSLSAEETSSYILHRLNVSGVTRPIFSNEACRVIFEYSKGTPRLINLLCDTALVYGYAEQKETIDVDVIHDVVREQHGDSAVLNLEIDDLDDEMPAFVEQKLEDARNELLAETEIKVTDIEENGNADVIERALKSSAEDKVHIELEKLTTNVIDVFDQVIEDIGSQRQAANERDMFIGVGARPDGMYPIMQIEKSPKKDTKMLIMGVVAGVFAASIIMMTAGWFLFGSNEEMRQMFQQSFESQQQKETRKAQEKEKLNALLKERDAAIAAKRALEQERDAALKVAEAQKKLHQADLLTVKAQKNKLATEQKERLALAKQKQQAAEKLKAAEERLKKAELAKEKAVEREYQLKLDAEIKEAKLETQRLQALKKERERLEELALIADRERLNALLSEEEDVISPEKAPPSSNDKLGPKINDSFSANPCDSPSAKFLSTCKK